MNRKQRACVVAGFFLLVASLLFPLTHPYRLSPLVSYRFLFIGQGSIDFARLFAEWVLIALVAGGLVFLLRGPDSPKPETEPVASERNWRRLFWLSVALYVLIAALGITSYVLFRKVRRLEAGIQDTIDTMEAEQRRLIYSRETLGQRVKEDQFALTESPFTMEQRLLQDKTDTLQQIKEGLYKLH